MRKIKTIFLAFLIFISATCNFVQMNDKLLQKIYKQNQNYIIYVYDQPSFEIQSIFMEFCHKNHRNCAILDESIKDYNRLIEFIGFTQKEYFLVIDGSKIQKFILQANKVKNIYDLELFEKKISHNQWQPFYASQKPKSDRYIPCRSLSGVQLKSFLQEPGMKTIYLYSNQKRCQICGQMLRYYADTADNFYKKNQMSFGYINIDLNDHPLIRTKQTPSFLLFESSIQLPQKFAADEYEKMQMKIEKLLQEHTGEVKSLTRHEYTKFLSDLQDI